MRADRLTSIHHVQVAMPAGGEAAARRFYGDLLGVREIGKPVSLRARGGVWFATDTLQLHLGVDPAFVPATKAHVAFEVTDLAAVRERCEGTEHPASEDAPLPAYGRCSVDDLFGNRIERLQPAETTMTIIDHLLSGPDLSELDLERDRSPMRDAELD